MHVSVRDVTLKYQTHSGRSPLLFSLSVYAAAAWSFVFAALSFYWALGGNFLIRTQSPQILELAANPWFLAVVWLTGRAQGRRQGLRRSHSFSGGANGFLVWLRQTANWGIGFILTFYGGANLAVRELMALGVLETPASMRSAAAWWHLILVGPVVFTRRRTLSRSGVAR